MTALDLPLGRALADRYRLERELGAGGMATVYLAEDLKHHRKVAIKVMRPEVAATIGAERFLKEIETTAGLRHPHILPLYDSGEAGGALFYVMPFVEGESLRDRLTRERVLPIEEALAVAREVADALGYAHSRGIVHRDIKPENILLEGGHAVVADFGIARAVSAAGGERLTQTGLTVGTPLYMSPEQAAGSPEIDGRSDLYSLACVVYEMLGGEPPFTGPNAAAVTRQHLVTEPAPITNKRPGVPAAVSGALARALAKDPADRFSPAAQFAQALGGGSTTGTPARRPRRIPGRPLAIAAGIAAVALAVWFGWRAFGSQAGPRFERVAVLPMENQTGDTTQAFFAEGMTRELIGVLGDAGLRVLGHRAVAPYRNSTLPTAEIARELGVDAIVSGAVLSAGDVVQISAELTDPKTGESLWSRSFSRPAADVVTLQHDLASRIAQGVRARLTPEQARTLASARPVNPQAYTQYLLGQQQATLRTPDGFARGVQYLSRSLALDSTFAPAWAALAMANAYGLLYQLTPRDSGRAVIERAAARAAELDDRLADPWYARGVAHLHADWNFAAAEEDFRRGRERNGSAEARGLYGWTMWEVGQHARAIEATKQLIALEPTTAQWRSDIAWSYWSSGDSAAARASLLAAIAADSTFYEAYDLLGMVESDAGNFAASARAHQKATEVAGGDYWVRQFSEGVLHKAKGDMTGLRKVIRELEGDPRYAQRAVMHYLAGETETTYALLERAMETRDGDLLWVLSSIPYLKPLHAEARYRALLRRVGLAAGQGGDS
jgi:serine/threonine-protein kinase